MTRRPTAAHLSTSLVTALALALAGCGSETDGGGTEGGSGDTGPSGTTSQSASELCVSLINKHRATVSGLTPYERWTDAEVCASEEAKSDAASGVAHGAFPQCGESAQNECPGWAGKPEEIIGGCLDMMWAEGPGEDFATHGHYINMSSKEYTKVACGFFILDNGDVWAIQNFK
jgi:hypothetical protein